MHVYFSGAIMSITEYMIWMGIFYWGCNNTIAGLMFMACLLGDLICKWVTGKWLFS